MHMVWHDDMRIHGHPMKMGQDIVPKPIRDDAPIVEDHRAIDYLAQRAFALVCADGDKIYAWLGVVVLRQTNGTAVMFVWIVCHIQPVGAGSPRPVAPSITPHGSRQNNHVSLRTTGARRPPPLQSAMRHARASVDNTVRFASEPSCAVTHRMGEEAYAPTDVRAVCMCANNTSAGSSLRILRHQPPLERRA